MRTADITGTITLPEGTEMVMPGDNITAVFELITPIALEKGLRFAPRGWPHGWRRNRVEGSRLIDCLWY